MTLPSYISWTGCGSSCGEPPGVFTGATMHLFGIGAKKAAMQALADKFLQPVTSGKYSYAAFVDAALLTIADIEKGTTAVEVVGWLPGRECALWIPLIETRKPTLFQPFPSVRLVMWSPYIFISYAIGMITGREVWGWSKSLGDVDFPAAGSPAPAFGLDTVVFKEFDATKPGGKARLLTVEGKGPLGTLSTWSSVQDAVDEIIGALTGGMLPAGVGNPFATSPDFPAIALKQFRDSASPTLACYQAIVNSPVRIKNFAGGGFHTSAFDLTIETCASHPIAEKFLGLPKPSGASTTVPIDWAAWVKFDFDALAGSVIAKA
jgi:hypothetical protein